MVCFNWLVRTSNAVSIDVVLGDEPIVVTPSVFTVWHGIAMRINPFRFPPLAELLPHTLDRFTHTYYIITYAADIKFIVKLPLENPL